MFQPVHCYETGNQNAHLTVIVLSYNIANLCAWAPHKFQGKFLQQLTYVFDVQDATIDRYRLQAPADSGWCLDLFFVVHLSTTPRPAMRANPRNGLAAYPVVFPSSHSVETQVHSALLFHPPCNF